MYIDPTGRAVNVHEMLAADLSPQAGNGGQRGAGRVLKSTIRFVRKDVAIEDGTSQLATDDAGNRAHGRYTAVWVLNDGRWLLHSLRDLGTAELTGSEHLAELDWLIGNWVSSNSKTQIEVTARYSDDGNYILCEFEGTGPDRGEVHGSLRIGWDPREGAIKSWTFNSNGGYSEGYWYPEGNAWRVEQLGVLPDGQETSMINYFAPSDSGWTLRSTEALVGDEPLPDLNVSLQPKESGR